MAHLTLAGLSEDGKRLLLVSDTGVEFTLDVDTNLRAVLRGDNHVRARLGQLEIKMESVLRPRDIQARIRAGETPEAVAAAAQTTVDKIMPFAAPVLAEREHVAQRAQRASLRRSAGTASAASRTLGDAIGSHLRALNVDPGGVDWDAWRREDGRWTLTATFQAGAHEGQAAFTFDAPGNYVSADDDEARWLVGDGPAESAEDAAPASSTDDLSAARRRRLAAVPPDELPLGEDAIDLVTEVPVEPSVPDSPGVRGSRGGLPRRRAGGRRHRTGAGAGRGDGRVRRRLPRRRAGRPSCQAQGTSVRAELGRDHVRRRQARLIGSLSVAATSVAGAGCGHAKVLVPEAWVERLARIALALPDAYQEEAWVGERWRVRGRTFAHVLPIEAGRPEAYSRAVGSPGPHVVMTFRADPEELEAIIRSGPRYFRARWGTDVAGVVIDDDVDWEELRELVTESYCRLAPRKLVRLVDRPPVSPGR